MKEWIGLYQEDAMLCVFDLDKCKNRYMRAGKVKKMRFSGNSNIFITPNTLGFRYDKKEKKSKIRRKTEYFQSFEALYADIDLKLSDFEMNEEDLYKYLCEEVMGDGLDIPMPTMTVYSGHGIHLYWKIKSTQYKGNIEKWKAMQEYIYKCLKRYGADPAVSKDPVRVLRVPDTYNKKNGIPDTMCKKREFTGNVYELDVLLDTYNVNVEQNKQIKERKRDNVVYTPKFSGISTYKRMNMYRMADLEKLAKTRGEGTRELILFLYNNYAQMVIEDKAKALEKTLELNQMMPLPLDEREVIKVAQARKEYRYMRKEKIIELLGITEKEMRELKLHSLVSDTMKKEQRAETNRAYYEKKLQKEGKQSKTEKLDERRKKVAILLELGKTEREIIEQLDISRATFQRDKKIVTSQEWKQEHEKEIKQSVAAVEPRLVFAENKQEENERQLQEAYNNLVRRKREKWKQRGAPKIAGL